MNWASFVLAALKLALSLTSYLREKAMLQSGQDKAVAQAALAVLEATDYGRELRKRIASLTDEEADDLWDRMLRG